MDFFTIRTREVRSKDGSVYTLIWPDFKITRSKDIMVLGKSFYAIWDEKKQLWSTDEYDVQRLVDEELQTFANSFENRTGRTAVVETLQSFETGHWRKYKQMVSLLSDNAVPLDHYVTYQDVKVKKEDYVSKKLPYFLDKDGEEPEAYNELISRLYSRSERDKIEWAIGAALTGDAQKIEKFLVLFGAPGTGKSTVLKVIQKLFEGYYTTFDAKSLGDSSKQFAMEAFVTNPIVAIQHDGDLSRISDNTRINSIVSHDEMTINVKYRPAYTIKLRAMLFMGTNTPVKITNSSSGIIRRLIDVHPTGNRFTPSEYFELVGRVDFELGAIARHCINRYREMGPNYYNDYTPSDMMKRTDAVYNFMDDNFDYFAKVDGVTLSQLYKMYKEYVDDAGLDFIMPRYKFKAEMEPYFKNFEERATLDNGDRPRNWFSGFNAGAFMVKQKQEDAPSLDLSLTESLLDDYLSDMPAQYATEDGTPRRKWDDVETTLKDLDTSQLHYVKIPENHVVIDFDLKNVDGEKDASLNLREASKWPPTYAEWSQGGKGIHLHYTYDGDVSKLSHIFKKDVEVKVFKGNSSLRRRLRGCNDYPIATLSTGLPLKEEKMDASVEKSIKDEKHIRALIGKALRREVHENTAPSVSFIYKVLDDAFFGGLTYDVRDLRPKILAFAAQSTNQSKKSIELVNKMHFVSEEVERETKSIGTVEDAPIVIFDVEVFPNLFVICWKYLDSDSVMVMTNPTPEEVERLCDNRLIGFNNRQYDNHILYAAMLGYDNQSLFKVSQNIIANSPNARFLEAYNLSYADIYDYMSKKQSLKKFEIELGIHHKELGLPWDQSVPEDKWPLVWSYCQNDVRATQKVFEAYHSDYEARLIVSHLSGLPVNSSTRQHAERIMFGRDRNPQEKFVYTDLREMFPGYDFTNGVSTYKGEEVGEGGLVRAKPGMWRNVTVLDVESMHPTSIEQLNLFGPYTDKFSRVKAGRIAIKHGDYDKAAELLGDDIREYTKTEDDAKNLSYALKIVINIVYGLTSAKFSNKFKDNRNVDNIVAKRGALFMVDLMHYVEDVLGKTWIHIKTDSIKIIDADEETVGAVMEFGRKYGYTFDIENRYAKMCLVNDAVYIAKTVEGEWEATGKQFQVPYVFKTLFSREQIEPKDYVEVKNVKTAMWLNFDGDMRFVGKTGAFIPVVKEAEGGILLRENNRGGFDSVVGTKGYTWLEAESLSNESTEKMVDLSYYRKMCDDAIEAISQYGDFEEFRS